MKERLRKRMKCHHAILRMSLVGDAESGMDIIYTWTRMATCNRPRYTVIEVTIIYSTKKLMKL